MTPCLNMLSFTDDTYLRQIWEVCLHKLLAKSEALPPPSIRSRTDILVFRKIRQSLPLGFLSLLTSLQNLVVRRQYILITKAARMRSYELIVPIDPRIQVISIKDNWKLLCRVKEKG